MDDDIIIGLFFERSEKALTEVATKYGRLCLSIANGILKSSHDAEECVNESYFKAWNAIPPQKPANLAAFLGKIVRNSALDRYAYSKSAKRCTETDALFSELDECIPDKASVTDELSARELTELLNKFLASLPKEKRVVFMRRYWFGDSIGEIADRYSMSRSKVKSMLMRLRNELKDMLGKEGHYER